MITVVIQDQAKFESLNPAQQLYQILLATQLVLGQPLSTLSIEGANVDDSGSIVVNSYKVGGDILTLNAKDATFTGSYLLVKDSADAEVWSLDTDGLKRNGTKVLNTRVTGWVAATGTKARTTFVTDTATTAQVAARLGQLIDDLFTHGLIGP